MMPRRVATKTLPALVSLTTLVVVVGGLAIHNGALAESSSWFQKSDAPPAKKPAPASPVKGPTSDHSKTVPTTVPATGEDAAYTAFDQGQYLTALKLAEEDASHKDPQAHTLIARIYAEGLGVPKNEKTAVNWYTRAVDLGDVPAMFALGIMLAEGRGVEKNRDAAAKLFERAALTGHALANYNLGLLFLKGDGKPENPIRAAQHIRYAAEKGIAQAQYDLAGLYQSGTGVAPNALETAQWLSRAAEQNLAAAQYDYAVLLLKGLGLTRDEPKAVPYLKAAAEKGIAGAQNRLAYVYLEGIGTDKNPIEAAKWRLIAQKSGLADKSLDDTVAKLAKADRQAAEKAASEWADRIQIQPSL